MLFRDAKRLVGLYQCNWRQKGHQIYSEISKSRRVSQRGLRVQETLKAPR